jgi:hypothetical protein
VADTRRIYSRFIHHNPQEIAEFLWMSPPDWQLYRDYGKPHRNLRRNYGTFGRQLLRDQHMTVAGGKKHKRFQFVRLTYNKLAMATLNGHSRL